ncbi:MAG: hypothetical protein K2J42_07265 [Muribaculaceae bacterium]|nr:hypothetical protein [Muribaculaceae bacterium]
MYNLRKVSFCKKKYEFYPDLNANEQAKEQELTKFRDGYFHKWVEEPDNSKDIPYVKTMALIEGIEDGEMYLIDSANIKFVQNHDY